MAKKDDNSWSSMPGADGKKTNLTPEQWDQTGSAIGQFISWLGKIFDPDCRDDKKK